MFFRRYTISTQLCFNPLPFLCLFCPISAGRKKFSTDIIFCFGSPLSGKNFACSAAGNLSYIASSASGNCIGYAKVFRDEGERATTGYRPQKVPRFASRRSADRTSRCRKSHRQQRDIFCSARLCTVPLDLLTQACLLYDSLSSWGA